MLLCMMIGTERVVSVVSVATVPGVGKHNVLVLVVTDPVVATIGLGEIPGFTTEAAFGF
jgi:hypothetical protein